MGIVHHVRLTNLHPATTYHYRIVAGGFTGGDLIFSTGPGDPCKPFSFVAMGDNRSQIAGSSGQFGELLLDALGLGVNLMVNTGDLVKDGAETDQWASYLSELTAAGRFVPVMPIIGNHDDGPGEGNGQNITRIFRTPKNNDSGNRSYYSFRYGNAFFAVVNNHDESPEIQAAWLNEQLEQTDAIWKFVFIHEPFFTCPIFGLGHDPDESGVGHLYQPIFKQHHVDIVFTVTITITNCSSLTTVRVL